MSSVFGKPRAGSGPQITPLEVNLAILGRRGAGKSALTVKFLTKRFISEYDPNLEDTYSSEETVDHQPVHLRVMDTADLDTPRNCERYLNWAHAFLVVYSVDSRQSFDSSSSYLELLALHAKETQRSVPALLLGNKLDMAQYRHPTYARASLLFPPTSIPMAFRQVTKAEGVALAGRFGCLFFEVSACLDFEHVQHVFHEAVREARRELEKSPLTRPLFISEERALPHQAPLTARHGLASCTFNTLSTVSLKEMPTVAQAKLVTVKSSRAQSKRKAPTLTLLKGFKIF
ncbi:PREDICTED: ras-like protein family member 12 isoform X1 [Cercocebus atys]|uniref:small monomeric GTPase n=2 Tax=Cercocebus atys TaxID=9531 RepID=A0A2K5NPB9_CERAT|nr:PREDICTED: ras-like protein family member 12 isoform X1 [Cercocebus atys]XP_011948139.1 PREDICTED: ras-like protein family member 12 isoform X1 [Cercocebus atys]